MLDDSSEPRPPLLVFADDWGRHPSSCQHLIRELLPRYQVYWINTIGMRPPSLDFATLTRGAGKVREWLGNAGRERAQSGNPRVFSPYMWPSFGHRMGRRVNRAWLPRQIGAMIGHLDQAPVAITTLPITADLMGRLPVARWVYYCVDDFGQWPGLDHATLATLEEEVVQRCDTLIAVSETLQERLHKWGKRSELLTHGVDLRHWQAEDSQDLQALREFEPPLVVFWGLIDRRMDPGLVERTAQEMSRGTVLLVGPELDADPALWKIPRVRRLAAMPYADLPRLAAKTDVLIMPYADLSVTRAIQPLKLKEYLATGKPVVARTLPATQPWADCLDLAATPAEFANAVAKRIAVGLPGEQLAARERLKDESWEAKAQQFERWAIPGDAASPSELADLSQCQN